MQDRIVHQGHPLNKLFPNCEISVNSRKQAALKTSNSRVYCELDIWIPELHICFEFQDPYHYVTTWYSHNPIVAIQSVDNTKNELIRLKHDTLVIVPCWWDGNIESLCASIWFHRPELFNVPAQFPIELNPQAYFFERPQVPDVGELMLASYPPTDHKPSIVAMTSSSWWIGEKYDGVRCCWHAIHQVLYSRSGKKLVLLPEFFHIFPGQIFVDGELWFGRGQFALTQQLVVGGDLDVLWPFLRVITFDAPVIVRKKKTTKKTWEQQEQGGEFENEMDYNTMESRYSQLLDTIKQQADVPFLTIPMRCYYTMQDGQERAKAFVEQIIQDGGEGMILQHCNSLYLQGRSLYLFKLKASQGDQEGLVICCSKSQLQLQLATGRTLAVTPPLICEELQEKKDSFLFNTALPSPDTPSPAFCGLAVGDIVTFAYNHHRMVKDGGLG
eukprot:Phypoly_transcript_02858.p1 GENE.Phypoly_transcript_02858~~Phypoly_transcript_02858.p1  ORF type:complete len:442 (+),score=48.85 Phypoly_transcript_02858:287-1612(+)